MVHKKVRTHGTRGQINLPKKWIDREVVVLLLKKEDLTLVEYLMSQGMMLITQKEQNLECGKNPLFVESMSRTSFALSKLKDIYDIPSEMKVEIDYISQKLDDFLEEVGYMDGA